MKSWKFNSKKDLRSMPKVEIVWIDSCTSGRWRTLDDYQDNEGLVECHSIGYMTKKNKKEVQVVQQISREARVADSITIPRSCIKKIRRLK